MKAWGAKGGLCFGAAFILLFALSCGGGGGGGDGGNDGGSRLPQATITSEALAQSAAMALASGGLADLNQTFSPLSASGESFARLDLAGWVVRRLMDQLPPRLDGYQAAGAGNEDADCANGGSVSLSATWDGPDAAQDCSEIVNLAATMIFKGCTEGDLYADGRVKIRFTGNACGPTAMAMEFSDLVLEDNAAGMSATIQNLEMNFTNITWAGGEIRRMTVTLNGDVDGVMNHAAYQAQFSNYRMAMTLSDTGDTMQVVASGSLTGICLDGWVTFTTLEPIVIPTDEDCPISGRLRISGKGQGTVIFNDPGVRVNFGGQITDYPRCVDLPDCTN